MAAIICQYLFGERLLSEGLSIGNRNEFLLGLQGTSIFEYAADTEKVGRILQSVEQESCSGVSSQSTKNAFFVGLQCRDILCRHTNDFIRYGTAMLQELYPEQQIIDSKQQVESALDTILLRYETGKLPTELKLKSAVPMDRNAIEIAAGYYADCCQKNATVVPAEIRELLESGIKKIAKLNDRTTLKRQYRRFKEKRKKLPQGSSAWYRNISEDEDHDYANICQEIWQWPLESGTERTESFFDLFESALQEARIQFGLPEKESNIFDHFA